MGTYLAPLQKKLKKKLPQAVQHYKIRTSRFHMQHTWFQTTTETLLLYSVGGSQSNRKRQERTNEKYTDSMSILLT